MHNPLTAYADTPYANMVAPTNDAVCAAPETLNCQQLLVNQASLISETEKCIELMAGALSPVIIQRFSVPNCSKPEEYPSLLSPLGDTIHQHNMRIRSLIFIVNDLRSCLSL